MAARFLPSLGVRSVAVLLMAAAALPGLAFALYAALAGLEENEAQARAELTRTARLAAEPSAHAIEGTRQLLFAVSQALPTILRVGAAEACHEHLFKLVDNSERLFHSMGVFQTNGKLLCHSRPGFTSTDASDRRYFQQAMRGTFGIGEYQVGRLTGLAGLNLGYPVYGAERQIIGVTFAALDLKRLGELAAALPLPNGGILTITDGNGVIIAQRPGTGDEIGKRLDNPQILEALQGTVSLERAPRRGEDWFYAHDVVWPNPDGSHALHVVVGIPVDALYEGAREKLKRTLAVIGVATLALIGIVVLGAELLVMRGLGRMLDVARRVGAGELSARARLSLGPRELIYLGRALDRMAESLEQREAQARSHLETLSELAITDPLTGLANRRHLDDFLRRELARAARARTPLAVIMADLDHFKRVNDRHGHDAGDLVLKQFAALAHECVRGSDMAARSGGEEFVLVLPGTTRDKAVERAEALRRSLESLRLAHEGTPLGAITASFGIAAYPDDGQDAPLLLRRADEALYAAKGAGRNRVIAAASAGTPARSA